MDQPAPPLTDTLLRDALHDVIDPELGYNIVDLGLVYGIAIDDGLVDVTMTMTTPGCPAQDYIVGGVEQRLAAEPGVTGVFVSVVWDPAWSPRLMSSAAKAHFRIREDAE
ncbi:MAG TPA: metal-sulfur cluster assembly factor [Acetobacteraceae bacterium]|nr:metal-sulfur cluster assembly factor [Acetobacteraceae bacterium]